MKKFICPACGKKLSVFHIHNNYNKEEDSVKCPGCTLNARLRHFTKGIKIKEIEKHRNKLLLLRCAISIPIQSLIYYYILNLIFGG